MADKKSSDFLTEPPLVNPECYNKICN